MILSNAYDDFKISISFTFISGILLEIQLILLILLNKSINNYYHKYDKYIIF
jgi:hypothetical protein